MPFVAPNVNTVKMDLASAVLPFAAIVNLDANFAANCVNAVAGRACKPDSLVISTVNIGIVSVYPYQIQVCFYESYGLCQTFFSE